MSPGTSPRVRLASKRFSVALLVVLLTIGVVLSRPASAQDWLGLKNDMIEIEYVAPISPANWATYTLLKKRRVLEELSAFLSPLRLPGNLRIETSECLVPNAFYSRGRVRLCYELPAQASSLAFATIRRGVTRDDVIVGTFVLATLHEIGHAVFDMFEVPVFGREEDAADQIAAFVILNFGTDVARRTISGYAHYVRAMDQPLSRTAYADEHGTHLQRFYNLLCVAYGSQPDTFRDVVATGILPQERAMNCGREYEQVRFAFAQTVWPHIDQDLLKKVRTIAWAKWEGAGIGDLLADLRFRFALVLSGIAALLLYASSTSPKAFVGIVGKFDRTSFQGRLGRLHWWTYTITIMAADNLIYALLFFADRFAWPFGLQILFVGLSYALYGTLYWYAMFSIKRLHDRNRPGWLVVFWFAPWIVYLASGMVQRAMPEQFESLAPYIAIAALLSVGFWIWMLVGLGFRRGKPGENRFGPGDQHPQPEHTVHTRTRALNLLAP